MEKQSELTPEELDAQNAEQLPDREAMSIIDPGAGTLPPVPIEELDAGDDPKIDTQHGLVIDNADNAA